MRSSLLFFILIPLSVFAQKQPYEREITDNWMFKCGDRSICMLQGTATVPGNIHTDLLNEEAIPHPYKGMNELELQWIQDSTWVYETTFQLSASDLEYENIILEFEGLDTYATIFLNDLEIGKSENMFLAWQNQINSWVKEGENKLKVVFDSPYTVHENTAKNVGYQLPASNDAGENKVSPWVRKSPYHFGWDWAPKFTTCGIYLPVNLHFKNETYIEDVFVYTSSLTEEEAIIEYEIRLNQMPEKFNYFVEVSDGEKMYFTDENSADHMIIRGKCAIENPKLWWPNGWGEQPLLDFKITTGNFDSYEEKIGLRQVRLHQKPDNTGKSFYFTVNGQEIFAKGANYIPQDVFINNKTKEDYEALILSAKEANFNMLRVWGGGIYEQDVFYELCDEHGILVWQDLMFACSMYPGHKAFLESVREEVSYQVKRLRNHACLAHWNGNNEVNVAWNNWGWQDEYHLNVVEQRKIKSDYDQLFTDIIPRTVYNLDKRTYTHTSPLSNWGPKGDFNSGSMHYWGVWHNREPFENYAKNVGRFMSEYGFQSFPSVDLLSQWIPEDSLILSSESMTHRQKSYIGNGLISEHISQYFPEPESFEQFVELSQLTQAIAYEKAIEAHRLYRPHCMGTLYWQLNDCWPGPSWSTIDYEGNLKLAHHKVAEMYQSFLPIIRTDNKDLEIHLSNDSRNTETGRMTIKQIDAKTDKVLAEMGFGFEAEAVSTSSIATLKNWNKKPEEVYYQITGTTSSGESFSRTIILDVQSYVSLNSIEKFKGLFIIH